MVQTAWLPSPNHEMRRGTHRPDMIILHYTGMISGEAALAWLRNPRSGVSAHYQVFRNGRIVQLVSEERRAWQAGVAEWQGATDLNSRSIGIELENAGHDHGYPEFADRQIEATIALVNDIRRRWPIADARILAHSDVAPSRKLDPGEKFPWARLAGAGHGLWPDPHAVARQSFLATDIPDPTDFLHKLRTFGYAGSPHVADPSSIPVVVRAFQRHFLPWRVDGRIDVQTAATLNVLLELAGDESSDQQSRFSP